jgi:hypothetical protein
MLFAIVIAVLDVLWKCFVVVEVMKEGEGSLREDGKREDGAKQRVRVVKAVYSCGVRLVKAPRNVDVEAMM